MDLRQRWASLRDRLPSPWAAIQRGRPWIDLGVVVALALTAAVLVARSAEARVEAAERELADRLRRREALARWVADFHPASPAESTAWAESAEAVGRLAGEGVAPAHLANLVAERAEAIGLRATRLRLVTDDTISPPPPLAVGAQQIRAGAPALDVELRGTLEQVLHFVAALPPQVQLQGVEMRWEGDPVVARVRLLAQRVGAP